MDAANTPTAADKENVAPDAKTPVVANQPTPRAALAETPANNQTFPDFMLPFSYAGSPQQSGLLAGSPPADFLSAAASSPNFATSPNINTNIDPSMLVNPSQLSHAAFNASPSIYPDPTTLSFGASAAAQSPYIFVDPTTFDDPNVSIYATSGYDEEALRGFQLEEIENFSSPVIHTASTIQQPPQQQSLNLALQASISPQLSAYGVSAHRAVAAHHVAPQSIVQTPSPVVQTRPSTAHTPTVAARQPLVDWRDYRLPTGLAGRDIFLPPLPPGISNDEAIRRTKAMEAGVENLRQTLIDMQPTPQYEVATGEKKKVARPKLVPDDASPRTRAKMEAENERITAEAKEASKRRNGESAKLTRTRKEKVKIDLRRRLCKERLEGLFYKQRLIALGEDPQGEFSSIGAEFFEILIPSEDEFNEHDEESRKAQQHPGRRTSRHRGASRSAATGADESEDNVDEDDNDSLDEQRPTKRRRVGTPAYRVTKSTPKPSSKR